MSLCFLVFFMLNFIVKNKGTALKAFLFSSDFFICVSLCYFDFAVLLYFQEDFFSCILQVFF